MIADVGPWEVEADRAEAGSRFWKIVRHNPKWFLGLEPLRTPGGSTRRFYDEQKANTHCAKLNAATTGAPAQPPTDP